MHRLLESLRKIPLYNTEDVNEFRNFTRKCMLVDNVYSPTDIFPCNIVSKLNIFLLTSSILKRCFSNLGFFQILTRSLVELVLEFDEFLERMLHPSVKL
jgi:hypothetical protein